MSIYKNYDIVPGDKILLNDEYQVGDSSDRLPKGTAFLVLNIRENDGYLECESVEKFKTVTHYSVISHTSKKKIKCEFHITSNISTWFDIPLRDANLKILLDE